MRQLIVILSGLLFFCSSVAKANRPEEKFHSFNGNELHSKNVLRFTEHKNKLLFKKRPSPLFKLFHEKQKRNQKLTASVLAFPFPFGIVGLHRIYLGCPPYIPVVYIGTLGGVFGALPLIDFFVILADKNTENYVNNSQVFMWIN